MMARRICFGPRILRLISACRLSPKAVNTFLLLPPARVGCAGTALEMLAIVNHEDQREKRAPAGIEPATWAPWPCSIQLSYGAKLVGLILIDITRLQIAQQWWHVIFWPRSG